MDGNNLNKNDGNLNFVSMNPNTNTAKTALIIDDSKMNQLMLSNFLKPRGFVTYFSENGEEGIKEFISIKPSITFLDIVMPRKTGLEVLKEIKLINPDAIVIMVSSFTSKENIHEAKTSHADWFLKKPISKEQILEILDRFENRMHHD